MDCEDGGMESSMWAMFPISVQGRSVVGDETVDEAKVVCLVGFGASMQLAIRLCSYGPPEACECFPNRD